MVLIYRRHSLSLLFVNMVTYPYKTTTNLVSKFCGGEWKMVRSCLYEGF